MADKKSLMQAFAAVHAALRTNDTAGIRELFAQDYEDFGIRGEITDKSTVLELYRPGGVQIEKFDCRDVRPEVVGAIGIVRGKGHIRGSFVGSVFEHHVLFTDIFVFRDARWQYYKTHSTEIKA